VVLNQTIAALGRPKRLTFLINEQVNAKLSSGPSLTEPHSQ